MRFSRPRGQQSTMTLAERERALGLDVPAEPEPVPTSALPEPAPKATPTTSAPTVAAPVVDRLAERMALADALLTWGEAHDWPRLPLARTARGPYTWLMAGEDHWYAFASNPIDRLRQAGAAIGQMEE